MPNRLSYSWGEEKGHEKMEQARLHPLLDLEVPHTILWLSTIKGYNCTPSGQQNSHP